MEGLGYMDPPPHFPLFRILKIGIELFFILLVKISDTVCLLHLQKRLHATWPDYL